MADPKPDPKPGANSKNSNSPQAPTGRDRLAQVVVVGSFLTLFLLVAGLLAIAQVSGANPNATNMAEKTFNTILPVLAGWVGTVLAFYFSAASLERTSSSLDSAIAKAAGGAVSDVTVAEKMIPLQFIREKVDLATSKPETIKLGELRDKFNPPGGTPITRMVFLDNGVFRYVMHLSVLNAFLLNKTTGGKSPNDFTFADMLQDADVLNQISKLVVFVKASATLAQAREALSSVPGAQDLIITGTGNASGPMLGWLTNVDLTKTLPV